MRFLSALLLLPLLAAPAAAQSTGATVAGTVRDSIARTPLAGAMVQLAPADSTTRFGHTATADSLGRFTIAGVPNGRYAIGFFHPMLDSLGVEAPLRQLVIDAPRPVRADLATPSPTRFRVAVCGADAASDSVGVVVGVVRKAADGAPSPGSSVAGEWHELSFTPAGLVRRKPRLVATTGENGWFAICNVPSAGAMTLLASNGADSTDAIEVQVPANGFLRRDLYLGSARTTSVDAGPLADSAATPRRPLRTGEARLTGTVVAAADGRPLPGASVGIVGGPQTRANQDGEWTLLDAPTGTRTLEVRAVGYYPERRPVHLVSGARPVRVALSTLRAVLDTVRVTASGYDRNRAGFAERQRRGAGRFITAQDIARRDPLETTDVFRSVSGLRLERDASGLDKQFLMRDVAGRWCSPSIHLDGHALTGLSAADVDAAVRPANVTGVEIYPAGLVPPQFERMDGCGAIVIWTR